MRSNINVRNLLAITAFSFLSSSIVFSQKTIQEHLDKKGKEKIIKKIFKTMGFFGGFEDGHGKNPYFTSPRQYDTLALTNFYLYDNGTEKKVGNYAYNVTTKSSVSEEGGKYFSNLFYKLSVQKLKETYKKHGVILLTPDEFLDTEEKKEFYYNQFSPEMNTLGKIIKNQNTNKMKTAVCANDMNCYEEHFVDLPKTTASFGYVLAKKLGVKATVAIAIQVANNRKALSIHRIRYIITGINPVPKQDIKYRGASWAKYHNGLIYFSSFYEEKKGMKFVSLHKRKQEVTGEHYEGFGELMSCFAEASIQKWNKAIEKYTK